MASAFVEPIGNNFLRTFLASHPTPVSFGNAGDCPASETIPKFAPHDQWLARFLDGARSVGTSGVRYEINNQGAVRLLLLLLTSACGDAIRRLSHRWTPKEEHISQFKLIKQSHRLARQNRDRLVGVMRSLDRQVLHRVPHLFSVESLDHECLPGLSSVAGILWLGIPLVEQIDPDFRAAEMRFSVAQSQPAAHTILRRSLASLEPLENRQEIESTLRSSSQNDRIIILVHCSPARIGARAVQFLTVADCAGPVVLRLVRSRLSQVDRRI